MDIAAAVDESTSDRYRCPCTQRYRTFTGTIPPFVGHDYFCDTGTSRFVNYYVNDRLWNGQGCGSVSSCCSFNKPPHGIVNDYHNQRQMTLKSGCALMKAHKMKTFL